MSAPKDYLHGTGLHPPAVALLGGAMILVGIGTAVIGTPALKLPGVVGLPTPVHLAKSLLGLWIAATGIGLLGLKRWARPTAVAMIGLGGIVIPLYPWTTIYVDWEFLLLLRAMTVLTSTIAVAYLCRPSITAAFAEGGVPVVSEGFYCAACNAIHGAKRPDECPHCGGPIYELLRSPSGVAYAREP